MSGDTRDGVMDLEWFVDAEWCRTWPGQRTQSSDPRLLLSARSMIDMILCIFSLVARLWLYLMNLEAGSVDVSGSQTGESAFCLGSRSAHRLT